MYSLMTTIANVPSSISMKSGECTEFQLHKSQQTIFNNVLKNIRDYSEYRLIRYVDKTTDQQQKLILIALLHDYKAGHVAVAWKRGQPIWIKVTKG